MENARHLELMDNREKFRSFEEYWTALGVRPEELEIYYYHHESEPEGWPSDWP